MANTRSISAQNSPTATRTRSSGHTPATTPLSTPRKAPHCTKCKRPMKGHPQSRCPPSDSHERGSETQTATSTEPLTNALNSMKLGSPVRVQARVEEENKVFIRNRRRQSQAAALAPSASLSSLSTNSSELVARLMEPGMLGNIGMEESTSPGKSKSSMIVSWQETLDASPKKSRTPGRSPMPGTLIPPTPESSFESTHRSFSKEESPSSNINIIPPSEANVSSSSFVQRGQPLSRTMSAAERDIFVSRLSDEASATIYIIPKADADSIQSEATALKFITHLVMNDDQNDAQALLILGRSERAVEALFKKVEEQNMNAARCKKQGLPVVGSTSSALRAVAGGAVMGAVGTWAGLAFA